MFDKTAFRAQVKANHAVAANPTFVPVPDAGIADEAARATAFEAVMKAHAAKIHANIGDAAAHSAALLMSFKVVELWPLSGTSLDSLVTQAHVDIGVGDAESLANAAALLLIAAHFKLIKE